jgi:hypothetical protein
MWVPYKTDVLMRSGQYPQGYSPPGKCDIPG